MVPGSQAPRDLNPYLSWKTGSHSLSHHPSESNLLHTFTIRAPIKSVPHLKVWAIKRELEIYMKAGKQLHDSNACFLPPAASDSSQRTNARLLHTSVKDLFASVDSMCK